MRFMLFTAVLLFAVFASIDVVAQNHPGEQELDPGAGGDGGTGCAECTRSIDDYNAAECTSDPKGGWADCVGGSQCYNGADGSRVCEPYCGENRCLLA